MYSEKQLNHSFSFKKFLSRIWGVTLLPTHPWWRAIHHHQVVLHLTAVESTTSVLGWLRPLLMNGLWLLLLLFLGELVVRPNATGQFIVVGRFDWHWICIVDKELFLVDDFFVFFFFLFSFFLIRWVGPSIDRGFFFLLFLWLVSRYEVVYCNVNYVPLYAVYVIYDALFFNN